MFEWTVGLNPTIQLFYLSDLLFNWFIIWFCLFVFFPRTTRADNERLRQEQAAAVPGPGTVPSTSAMPSSAPSPATAPVEERLPFVPWERKCPMFRGRSGIGLAEWIEEVQACVRA